MARAQLGTVGSGNHYVDILEDEQDRIWVGVHFGSRGFGHKIATRFLNRAGAKDDMDSAPVALDSRTQEGQDYIAAMKLAGRYAYAGRDWVCDRVVKILGARSTRSITITTSRGASAMTAKICGSYVKALRRHSPARKDSSAEPWARPPSSWKA